GSSNVKIIGGPTRSVQVNSDNASCAAATSNAGSQCNSTGPRIDLSEGGPSFSGSDFAVVGQPKTAPTGFNPGTSGGWTNGGPISDPYMLVSAPTRPAVSITDNNPTMVNYGVHGCPDHTAKRAEYKPGLYTHPIIVKRVKVIFVPGVYFIEGTIDDNSGRVGTGCVAGPPGQSRYGLDVDSNGVVRDASTAASGSDGNNGVMFYLSGNGGAGHY